MDGTDGRMDGMVGWMDGWIDGWMNQWINTLIHPSGKIWFVMIRFIHASNFHDTLDFFFSWYSFSCFSLLSLTSCITVKCFSYIAVSTSDGGKGSKPVYASYNSRRMHASVQNGAIFLINHNNKQNQLQQNFKDKLPSTQSKPNNKAVYHFPTKHLIFSAEDAISSPYCNHRQLFDDVTFLDFQFD